MPKEPGSLLGPLTTEFTQPSKCSVLFFRPEDGFGFLAQDCVATGTYQDDPDCWPSRTSSITDKDYPHNGWGFYSPGLKCPVGYKSACTEIHNSEESWRGQFSLRPGETAVGCCPEGFSCSVWEDDANTCVKTVIETTVIQTGNCMGSNSVTLGTKTFPEVITSETQTHTREMRLLAPMFQLNFQSTDIATATTSTQLPSDSTSSPPDNGPSLSTGAKVGIGVGVALGVLLILVSAWLCLRRRQSSVSSGTHPVPHGAKGGEIGKPSTTELVSLSSNRSIAD